MGQTSAVKVDDIRTVAVLGAGTMGHGIAQVAAQSGWRVILRDVDEARVTAGRDRIAGNLAKGVELGKVDAATRDAVLARITVTTDVAEAARAADVVIEAVPELLELKRALFREAAAAAPAHVLWASNTSSLAVARIAEAVPHPENLVGMHFFNPVHLMKLCEVVHHAGSAPAAVACAVAMAERMGKTAITVADAPGFASSRLGIALGMEAIRMVEQGVASAADIDMAMKLGYGHPMGPLELTDLVGLDVRLDIAAYLAGELGDRFRPPELLRRMVAAGTLGKKSGQGFYRWAGGKRV